MIKLLDILNESYNPNIYQINCKIVISAGNRNVSDIISDIRAIPGITIVDTIDSDYNTEEGRHTSELSLKIDPSPFNPFNSESYDEILSSIKKLPDVRGAKYTSNPISINENKLHKLIKEVLQEKEDRCKRIADRKYDKPSAYKSGAIVRCRKGKIWKGLKEGKLNELDVSKYISSWVDTKTLKRQKDFPEAIFLYLKKEGYINKGEIYRVLTLDPLVVIIKQNTEYIDLDRFLEDNQDIEPYDDLYSTYQDEKEVIARLDPNFSFEDIHYASSTGMNMNIFLKDLDKNKLKNDILKKDQGKLLSFTKDKEAANYIFYTAIDHLEDEEDLEDNEFLTEDESLHKWFKRKGTPGKEGGWVDCNTCRKVDGKTKCKACGRKKGEKRAKYPSCRPTPAQCKTKGKGKKWGKTK